MQGKAKSHSLLWDRSLEFGNRNTCRGVVPSVSFWESSASWVLEPRPACKLSCSGQQASLGLGRSFPGSGMPPSWVALCVKSQWKAVCPVGEVGASFPVGSVPPSPALGSTEGRELALLTGWVRAHPRIEAGGHAWEGLLYPSCSGFKIHVKDDEAFIHNSACGLLWDRSHISTTEPALGGIAIKQKLRKFTPLWIAFPTADFLPQFSVYFSECSGSCLWIFSRDFSCNSKRDKL